VSPVDRRDLHFPLRPNRIDVRPVIVQDCDRGCCWLAPLRRSVDAYRWRPANDSRGVVRGLRRQRPMGPSTIGLRGRRASNARAWDLVDRCATLRQKAADSGATGPHTFPLKSESVSDNLVHGWSSIWGCSIGAPGAESRKDGEKRPGTGSAPQGKDQHHGISCLHSS